MTDPNAGLKLALLDYVYLEYAPHYAVLVTGAWGIGKTFTVTTCLDAADPDIEYYYVSLFGTESSADIDAAIFKAVHPKLGGKAGRVGSAVFKSVLKMGGLETELSLEQLLSGIKGGVYVFDDLERSKMPVSVILGHLNAFVEHDDCKVIIIANTEHELNQDEDFQNQKEKLIGRTLRVRSSISEALGHFLGIISDEPCRSVLQSAADTIIDIYNASEADNLRVLQQSLWDFERLYLCLSDKQKEEGDIVDRLLRLVLGYGIEIKLSRLGREDVEKRASRFASTFVMTDQKKIEKSGIIQSDSQYPMIDLFDPLLSNDVLESALLDGEFNADAIQASINEHPPFRSDEAPPSWLVLGYGPFESDEILDAALATHKEEFADRTYSDPEILLHLLGIRQRLAEMKLIETTKDKVFDELIAYTEEIKTNGSLRAIDPNDVQQRLERTGYMGLSYSSRDEPGFKKLVAYLQEACHQMFFEEVSKDAPDLLRVMEKDAAEFLRSIAYSGSSTGRFMHAPVFAAINPGEFVERLMALPPSQQLDIVQAFYYRYKFGALSKDLADEVVFIKNASKIFEDMKSQANGFTHERLSVFQRQFEAHIERVEQAEDKNG